MSQLTRNVVANLAGAAWTSSLGFLFIPVYLKLLGIEAYGLVGFFATLQSVFGLMDMGLSATLNREMARLSVRSRKPEEQRDLLRTLEVIYWSGSLLIGLTVFALAGLIARDWVNPQELRSGTVENAVRLMAVVMALQLPFGFYHGGLMGLERQVLVNGLLVVSGTVRGVGAILLLWLVSPSIEAFFAWQAVVSASQTLLTGLCLWQTLPTSDGPPRFRISLLRGVWRFAAGISGNAILGAGLTQLDKVLLSKLLTLSQFGYYMLAWSTVSLMWSVIVPINQALYPRFAQLHELRDDVRLTELYHRACQVMAVILLPVAIAVVFFPREVLVLWTWNPVTADNTYPIVSLLMVGVTLNGLASVAGYLQVAAGWPQLMMYGNLISAIVLVPAVIFMASHYGALGAALVWVALNTGYVVFNIPIMHRRLLRGEQWRWYFEDLVPPLAAALGIGIVSRWLAPSSSSSLVMAAYLFGTWLVSLLACASLAQHVRIAAFLRIRRMEGAYGG